MIEGLLLIDKPAGISSFGVVAKVRGIVRAKTGIKKIKVGHTGTLDPAATGLLVLAIGTYTKRVPSLIKQDKIYEVTMTLGKISSTGDKEGDITKTSDMQPTKEQIEEALARFTGELMQTPPTFSAIKVNGQRAYDLARKGKDVQLEPRKIVIHSNELIAYNYPIVQFASHVGSGTYIRSLVADIGKSLGVGAYMSDLRRTKIGSYSINDAVKLPDLNTESIQGNIKTLTKL
jgi:tRNA pseudouridine55 synthase